MTMLHYLIGIRWLTLRFAFPKLAVTIVLIVCKHDTSGAWGKVNDAPVRVKKQQQLQKNVFFFYVVLKLGANHVSHLDMFPAPKIVRLIAWVHK